MSIHCTAGWQLKVYCYVIFNTKVVSIFNFQRTIRLLLDTRGASNTFGLGIDREMALAIYRVGSEHEYAEVQKQKQI